MDYLAQNYFAMIFAGWIVYLIDALFNGNAVFFLFIFAAFCTLIGLPTFLWRYHLIASTFKNGTETLGQVTGIKIISKDYLIQYEYDFKGQKYRYRSRVKKNIHAQNLKQGQQVNLLVYEKTPQIAFIKEIYLEHK